VGRGKPAPRGDETAFDVVERIGLALPDVEVGRMYGAPALKVHGRMFACLASHRSAEPNTLVVRLPFDRRDELIAEAADLFYLTDHYIDYPCVLVRLPRVRKHMLRDLLRMGWRFMSTQKRLEIRTHRSARPRRAPQRLKKE
jgi:hypothetical protein